MGKMVFKGIDEYVAMLDRMGEKTPEMIDEAVKAGAGVLADALRAEIESLPVEKRTYAKKGEMLKGPNAAQKKGLLEGLGITPVQIKDGYYDRKIGFDGYNAIKTKRWPKGQPNAMIARAINGGTSFLTKTPFVDRAVRKARKAAEAAMAEALDKSIEKMEG